MRYTLAVLIVLVTTYMSKIFSQKYTYRAKFFFELQNFLIELKRNIRIVKEPISKLGVKSDSTPYMMYKQPEYIQTLDYLKPNEKDVLQQFFSNLGRYDSYMEEGRIGDMEDYCNKLLVLAENEKKQKTPLYLKLGLAMGVSIVLILM